MPELQRPELLDDGNILGVKEVEGYEIGTFPIVVIEPGVDLDAVADDPSIPDNA